jgi:uncharacterized protein YjiS (DUF1127 family)
MWSDRSLHSRALLFNDVGTEARRILRFRLQRYRRRALFYLVRVSTAKALRRLDDRTLKDIGLQRGAIESHSHAVAMRDFMERSAASKRPRMRRRTPGASACAPQTTSYLALLRRAPSDSGA